MCYVYNQWYDISCAILYVPESHEVGGHSFQFQVRPNVFSPSWWMSGDYLKAYSYRRKQYETLVKIVIGFFNLLINKNWKKMPLVSEHRLMYNSVVEPIKFHGVVKFILAPTYIDKEISGYLASKALVGVMLLIYLLLCLLILTSISIRDLSLISFCSITMSVK